MSANQAQQRTSAPSDNASVRPLEDLEDTEGCSGKEDYWRALNTECQAQIGAQSVEAVAKEWGVSAESLHRLGVGFKDKYACTFPMLDSAGDIVGIRKRPRKDLSAKHAVKDSALGLFIPDGIGPNDVGLICEGESDTAAALTLGFDAIGTPGAGALSGEVAAFVSESLVACPCILADNDGAGGVGAEKLANALALADVPCRILFPPEPHNDLRDWLRNGELTREELSAAVQAQDIRWPEDWPPGYVQIPNAFLRRGAVERLGRGPFALACLLKSYYGGDGKICPDREELAQRLGVTLSTVDRYKTDLAKAGVAKWQTGRTNRANEYRVDFGPFRKRVGR